MDEADTEVDNMIKLKDILSEAKSINVGELKVGQKFVVNQEPGILSANRSYYKLSVQKFGDVVFQVYKVNPKSVAVRALKGGDKLPWSASPASGGMYVDKNGNTKGYGTTDLVDAGNKAGMKVNKRFVFATIWTQKGEGNVPVTLK
jgi:hypothetical protein